MSAHTTTDLSQFPSVVATAIEELPESTRGRDDDILSSPEREVIEPVMDAGFERLGVGTGRVTVALSESLVVKIPRPDAGTHHSGFEANRLEDSQYRQATTRQREVLARVDDMGANGRWLTMERAGDIAGAEHELPEGFRDRCLRFGVDPRGDILPWNVGYLPSTGTYGLIDYGHAVL